MPIPEAIKNAPVLQMGLELYLTAWLELNSCRAMGFTSGPIPWLAVHTYSEQLELDGDQVESLHHHIKALDTVYLEHVEQKNKASNKGNAKS